MIDRPRISSLGDDCVTVDFGNEISIELNSKAIALAARLNTDRFEGFIEAVPAYSSVSVFFKLADVRRSAQELETALASVTRCIDRALENLSDALTSKGRIVEIAVDFGAQAALDLEHVAEFARMSQRDVVELFTSKTYRVYMLGFLPGFTYMGEVDERIAIARRETPRTSVPKGSVGIAGRQTGIYPSQSPGGWQIIGRTNAEMFSLDREPNSLLQPGDEVRFVPMP
jgi:inhibitor of KinA